MSQSTVSLIERGHLADLTVATLRAVGRALDVWLPFEPRWRGAELPRLIDQRHADLTGQVVGALRQARWDVCVEYSFNWRGERGCVDVLAWRPDRRAVLVVEVKTQIVDVQELFSTLNRKRRIVPAIKASELGWPSFVVGCVVVLPESTRARFAVERHGPVFGSVLPARNIEVRHWLRDPTVPLAGIWFLRYSDARSSTRVGGGATRIRVSSRAQLRVNPRSVREPRSGLAKPRPPGTPPSAT